MAKKVLPQWRRFGRELRRRRELAGLTQDQLGRVLSTTYGTISAIERAVQRPKLEMVEEIDHQVSADGMLVRIWHNTNDEGGGLASWFKGWGPLFGQAIALREYHNVVIPGLLQTSGYARTILRAGQPWATDDTIDEQVTARIGRQGALASPTAPHLIAVLDETVLRRPIGGSVVMGSQLDRLIEASEGRVDIHVIPFDSEQHPGLSEAFTLVRVPEHGEILYMETRVGATAIDDIEQVESYSSYFADLRGAALSLQASRRLIESIRKEFS